MRSQRAQSDALRLLALSAMAAAAVLLQTACLRAALLNHLNSLNWGSAGGIECPQSGNCSISTQGSTTGAYGSGTSWTVSTNLQVSDSSIIHTGTSTAQASIGSPDDLSIPFYVETNSGYVSLAKHFDVEQPLIYRVSGNLQDESSVVLYQYPFGFNFAPVRYKVWPGESPLPFAKSGVLYPGRYQYQLNAAAHAATQTVPYQPSDSAQMSFNVNLTFEPAKAVVSGIGALGVRRKTGETIALPEGEDTYLGSGDTIFTQGDSRAYVVLSDGYHQLNLGNNSSLTLEDEDGFTIGLRRGFLRNFINSLSPNRRYELRTPIIAIAVRGTAFSVRHFAAGGLGTSTVSVDDGIVDIFDRLTGQLLTTLGPGENFSYTQPQVVPEPATSVLLLLAGVPALLRGRRSKQ